MFGKTPADQLREHSNGEVFPLAFFYDDKAYYFDVDELQDDKSTICVDGDDVIEGIEANQMLVSAVQDYGKNRKRAWIAPFFNGCVTNELEDTASE